MEQKKYEITDIAHPKYPWLHRIRALVPVNEDVKAGDLGGYVQTEDNLSQKDTCWIYDQAICCEDAMVRKDARMYDGSMARGSALIAGDARMYERACADGNCCIRNGEIKEDARVAGSAVVTVDAGGLFPLIAGNSRVYGNVCGWYVVKDVVLPGENCRNPTPDLFILEHGKKNVLVKERRLKAPGEPEKEKEGKRGLER